MNTRAYLVDITLFIPLALFAYRNYNIPHRLLIMLLQYNTIARFAFYCICYTFNFVIGNAKVAETVIERETVNRGDNIGKTALHYAAQNGSNIVSYHYVILKI